MENSSAPRTFRARLASDPNAAEVSETLANGDTITGHPYAVRQLIASMRKTERRNARWPCTTMGSVDTHHALYFLISSFPSLRDFVRGSGVDGRPIKTPLSKSDRPNLRRFDAARFIAWACGAHATSATIHAARFVLHVWNPNADYRELDGLDAMGLDRDARILQPFNLGSALGCFDERHAKAVLRWVEAPFWP